MPAFDVVCALLVIAGLLKLGTPEGTVRSLRLAGVSAPPIAVRALGAIEVAVGSAAAVRPSPVTAGLLAGAYLVFCAFSWRLHRAGTEADCGCFGGRGATVGPIHIALNAIACGLATAAAIEPPHGLVWVASREPMIAVPLTLGMAAATFAAYVAFTTLPAAWNAYGGQP